MYKKFEDKKEIDKTYILPKLSTYSAQNFFNNFKNIIKNNSSDDFIVIGVFNERDDSEILSYNGTDIEYYEFTFDLHGLEIYNDCIDLTDYINKNKNKKFIIISNDGFYLAQSVARYISEFWLNEKEREMFMKLSFDKFADNFELSFWLRRSKFKLKITEEEVMLITAMNKHLIYLKEPSLKNMS